MASAKIFSVDGTEGASVELNDKIFDVAPNDALIHQVVVALMNNKRQGNAETKTRREVRGGGAKPFRQKGTGQARQGSSREPHMRGGGVVFGPHKRSYRQDVAPKMRRKALCCAFSDRTRNENLCVLSELSVDGPKTRPITELFNALAPEGRKLLLVTASTEPDLVRSSRNLDRVTIRTASDVNALDVVAAKRVVILKDAIAKLESRLS